MNIDTYEKTGYADYNRLAKTVAYILKAAVEAVPGLRLQQVQSRAKVAESLRKKLAERELLDTDSVETAVKDLAGCRLLFYTNSAVTRFRESRILADNFVVDRKRTKIHHPRGETDSAADLFSSDNYVVKLKSERASLAEYSGFADMWCEVQVQTILNHAWSELAHDMIYKRPQLEGGFGSHLMRAIGARMGTIKRKYLSPAEYEFQKVLTDFERLSTGKELFDRGALTALADCDDNNARYDLLERFETYVLPHYDDIGSEQADVRSAVIGAVKQARMTPTRPIEVPGGELPGHTIEDVVEIAGRIIDTLRYADIDGTFDAICELYEGAASTAERKRWLESAELLLRYDLPVLRQVGIGVQERLVERVRVKSVDASGTIRPVLISILGQVLKPEFSGSSEGFDRITFQRGAMPVDDRLREVRAKALEVLMSMFEAVESDAERRLVVDAIAVATDQSVMVGGTRELSMLVLRDSLTAVRFYTRVAPSLSYELRQDLEETLLWLYRHSAPDTAADPDDGVVAQQKALREAILEFRDVVNSDTVFVTYKTLVGFTSVFPPAWDDPDFDIEQQHGYREQRLDDLVTQVNADTAESWLAVLRRCAATESDDLATFPSFRAFLTKLGAAQPDIAFGYLDQLDDRLAQFLPAILAGLDDGPLQGAVRERLGQWLAERRYIRQISHYLVSAKTLDDTLLDETLQAAIEQDDPIAFGNLAAVAAARHGDVEGGLVERLFIPALQYFGARDDTRWVGAVWLHAKKGSLVKDLSAEQIEFVLNSLVRYRKIDFQAEDILVPIAANHPKDIIDFFGERVRLMSDEPPAYYEPVPTHLERLREPLSRHPEEFISAARAWFDEDELLFSQWGVRLLKRVFPTQSSEFERVLLECVRSGVPAELRFVVRILRGYNGESFLHGLCKEIVAALEPDDPLLTEVELILISTGVVSGEFGWVSAYERRKVELETWLTDPRERVRAFAERQIHDLEQTIALEQQRAEQRVEFRRREFEEEAPDEEDKAE